MSLEFSVDDTARPLVTLNVTARYSDDDDLQVIACCSENSEFPPQTAAGRTMTTDIRESQSYLCLPEAEESVPENYFREPSEELIEWFVGNPPPTYSRLQPQEQPIAKCSQIDQVPYSPMSPLIDQFPDYVLQGGNYNETTEPRWTSNQHFTGLGISTSGLCGQPNEIFYSACVVCGKSFPAIKEEVTLGYLEITRIPGETYEQQQARRRAFHSGMKAGSFILVPRGVSQAAACDGMLNQTIPEATTTATPDRENSQFKRNTKTSSVAVRTITVCYFVYEFIPTVILHASAVFCYYDLRSL